MKIAFIVITFFTLLSSGCKKESNKKYCWQVMDNLGNQLNVVCDKTEAELVDCIKNNTCGVYNNPNVTNCNYYRIGGEKFCWKISNYYFKDLTEDQAAMYSRCYYANAPATKADCNYACTGWYHRHKKTYKPNNSVTYSQVTLEQFCGDTAATLYQGRQIIIKDDLDSLIVIQFSNNGINW